MREKYNEFNHGTKIEQFVKRNYSEKAIENIKSWYSKPGPDPFYIKEYKGARFSLYNAYLNNPNGSQIEIYKNALYRASSLDRIYLIKTPLDC